MKLRIEHKALESALRTVAAGAARGASRPVLAGVRIDWDGKLLTLTCSDLDLTVTTTVAAAGTGKGVVIPPVHLLQRLVKAAGDVITLERVDNYLMTVTSDGTTSTLHTLPEGEWPRDVGEPITDGTEVTLDADARALVERVLPAVTGDTSRPILRGVLFGGDRVVATDSYRLHLGTIEGADLPEALVPGVALRSALKGSKGDLLVTVGNRRVSFEAGGVRWVTRLIEGDFPNYRGLLRDTSPLTLTVNRKALLNAVEQCSAAGFGTATPVRMTSDGVTLSVSVRERDVGSVEAAIPCGGDTLTGEFGWNPAYLLDALKVAEGDELTFGVVDVLKPFLCTDGDLLLLLMPVRIS